MILRESRVSWRPAWRIIASRYPPIALFERVADPDDLDAVFELESMTNPRLRDQVGDISLVPKAERVSGPGSSVIMAAFTHLNPEGSRFSDGSYGVLYAAQELETAIAETKHHRARFLSQTAEPATEVDMRVYCVDLDASLHDVRGLQDPELALYDPIDYGAAQAMGRQLRTDGADGVVYDSVRLLGGTCAGVFRPSCLAKARQERHLCYRWDGTDITEVYEKRALNL
ncbi:MAG: RES family NAD+ phosphorylase [Pseudomonadota bacterium]